MNKNFSPTSLLAALCIGLASAMPSQATTQFAHPFAPQEGPVKVVEQPYRSQLCLNGAWQFQPIALPPDYRAGHGVAPALPSPTANGWDTTPIRIPSPWNVNGFNRGDGGDFRSFPSYPPSWNEVSMGWLQRSFQVPAAWRGQRVLLHFDAVAGDAQVLVNGHSVAHNFDIFMPFEADVTDAIQFGATNQIQVGVRKASLFDDNSTVGRRTYLAGSFWGQYIAGIWQDVYLLREPTVRVTDTFIKPRVGADTLEAEVTLRNDTNAAQTVTIEGAAQPWINLAGRDVVAAPEPKWKLGAVALPLPSVRVTLAPQSNRTITLQAKTNGKLKLWSPEMPNLYGLMVSVNAGKSIVDRHYTRFGWREFTFQGNHQWLNGKPYELRGDAWHFTGIPLMSRRYAWAWFKALQDAHANAVRLHAQPYPSFFLDVADEMGICVLDESANWGSDGGEKFDSDDFWRRSSEEEERLVLRDRNHAAVFGWSLTNEDYAILGVGNRPDLAPRITDYLTATTQRVRALDPTRPWISGDGESDPKHVLPTTVGHYVGDEWLRDRAKENKPYGVGEAGGAYYATPKQAAKWSGTRAYVSQEGRMEGIATEAYELIKGQRANGVSYGSVFNLVWYGLQPLALGLPDTSKPPTLADGIFFGPLRDGEPGVQPERLGPYCATLNPGYDARLPLYQSWPLFDAIQAANAPNGPAPSRWDHRSAGDAPVPTVAAKPIESVAVLAGPGSTLPITLDIAGVPISQAQPLQNAALIILDGANPPALAPDQKAQLVQAVTKGATVWIFGVDAAKSDALNAILPLPVSVTERPATSLIIKSPAPILGGLTNGDLYFTETSSQPIMRHGLSGPLVERGNVLLEACNTDWRRWNGQAEPIKTGATIRSEREAKAPGAALVELPQGGGRYLVSTLATTDATQSLFIHLLTNLGVRLTPRQADPNAAFNPFGNLTNALVCGSFAAPDVAAAYNTDFIGMQNGIKPVTGTKSGERTWRKHTVDQSGAFDFLKENLPGPHEDSAVYLSFWLWSPLDLTNLLLNPNLPRLSLGAGSDDGCQIWLNGKLIKEDRGTHPLTPGSLRVESLPLQKGWNQFLVKVVQGTGQWGFAATLHSSDLAFLGQLRSAVAAPVEP